MAKILAPNSEYTGMSAGVPFVNGVGETEDPLRIAWFTGHGYTMESEEKPAQKKPAKKAGE